MTKEQLIDILKSTGIFTGSRAFGVGEVDSDWDYIVRPKSSVQLLLDNEKLIDDLHPDEGYEGDDSFSYDIKDPRSGRWYNFIWFGDDKEMNAWIKTTREMKKVSKEKIKNKEDRINMFEEFCQKFRKEGKSKNKESFKERVDRISREVNKDVEKEESIWSYGKKLFLGKPDLSTIIDPFSIYPNIWDDKPPKKKGKTK